MRSFALATGSSGNCFYVETKEVKILVDLGLSFSKIKEVLDSKKININDIDAVFITHEHADHISGLKVFAKKINCHIYMSKGTFDVVKKDLSKKVNIVKHHDNFKVKNLRIFSIEKSHDAKEALSFIFECEGKKLGIFTDLGEISDEIKYTLKKLDIIYFEANYCKDYINNNCRDMSYTYLNRLMSNKGHLGLHQTCDVLKEICHDNQKIILSHISENTNFYENVYTQVKSVLNEINRLSEIIISFQGEPTDWIE